MPTDPPEQILQAEFRHPHRRALARRWLMGEHIALVQTRGAIFRMHESDTARKRKSSSTKTISHEATPSETDVSLIESFVGYNLRRAAAKQRERFRSVFGPYNIRPSQLTILTVIQRNPHLGQSALGKSLDIKRANVVTLLDELEKRGLVKRKARTDDRRSYELHLTATGNKLTTKLLGLHAKLEDDLVCALGRDELETLVGLLREFRTLDSEPELD
jgi:DNA-binding MarR family transcriptional regulator